jgi:hypothetical protein
MHDPNFCVPIEGAGSAEAKHLLASIRPPGELRTAKGSQGRLAEPFSGQGGSAGIYDLGNGSSFTIVDLSFGVGPPQQASGFVQRRGRVRSGCSSVELIGEHRSPFRDPHARHASFRAKH